MTISLESAPGEPMIDADWAGEMGRPPIIAQPKEEVGATIIKFPVPESVVKVPGKAFNDAIRAWEKTAEYSFIKRLIDRASD